MDALNIGAGTATILALMLALWQHLEARRRVRGERDRLEIQRTQLAETAASLLHCAHVADAIVQQAKKPDASISELLNLARINRGEILLVVSRLEGTAEMLKRWQVGRSLVNMSQRQVTGGGGGAATGEGEKEAGKDRADRSGG
jgi:hypothetical protein